MIRHHLQLSIFLDTWNKRLHNCKHHCYYTIKTKQKYDCDFKKINKKKFELPKLETYFYTPKRFEKCEAVTLAEKNDEKE